MTTQTVNVDAYGYTGTFAAKLRNPDTIATLVATADTVVASGTIASRFVCTFGEIAVIPASVYLLEFIVNGTSYILYVTLTGVDGETALARSERAAALDSATATKIDDILTDTGTTLPAQVAALNNLSSAQVVSALGTGTWATALPWNTAWDAEVQSEVQDAIEVNNLDHLLKIAVDTNFATTVHLNSVIGNIADNGTTATFVRTTDSLEAIRDNQSSSSGASLEDIIAGVQSVSGGIIAAQDSSAFYITSGDTWTQDVDALGNIVGKTLVFTIKRNARDLDTAALVLINSTDGLTRLAGAAASNSAWGSLTVLDDTLGNIRLTLKSDATLLLKSGTFADGIKSLEVGDDMTLRQRGKTIISVGVINDIS